MSDLEAERALRDETAECLFVLATDFIPPTRIMQPEILDAIGQLDSALGIFRETGVAMFEEEFRACWDIGLRECAGLQIEGAP